MSLPGQNTWRFISFNVRRPKKRRVNSIDIIHCGIGALHAEKSFGIGSVSPGNGFGIGENEAGDKFGYSKC